MGDPDGHASLPFSTQARAAQGTVPLEFAHPTNSTVSQSHLSGPPSRNLTAPQKQLSGLGEGEEFKRVSVSV